MPKAFCFASLVSFMVLLVLPATADTQRTVNIRVSIPPLAEAAEAASMGAGGAWTLDSQGGGIMIGLTQTSAEAPRLSVFSGSRSRLDVTIVDGEAYSPLSGRLADSDGALTEYVYTLSGEAMPPQAQNVGILISQR